VAAGEGIKFAGLLVDSFSSDGVFTDPPGFLKAAVDVTRTALRLGRSFFRRRFPWRLSCLGSAPWRVAFVSMEAIPSPRNGRRVQAWNDKHGNDRPYRGPSELEAQPSFVGTLLGCTASGAILGTSPWAKSRNPSNVDSWESGPRSTIPNGLLRLRRIQPNMIPY
jgi:hypothetical protein